jgi:hypothetical protein
MKKGAMIKKKLQAEEEAAVSLMDPWFFFRYSMKARVTREKYRGRLTKFLIPLA